MKRPLIHTIIILLILGLSACQESDEQDSSVKENSDQSMASRGDKPIQKLNFKTLVVSPSEFISWVKDPENGLVKTRQINDLQFSLTYLPPAFMICNDLKKENISKKELAELALQYEDFEYYLLKIEALESGMELAKYKVSNRKEYEDRIRYYSFNMQNDLIAKLETGEEVYCELYHFERTYNITPYSSFLIGFPKEFIANSKERTIILEEKVFNKGNIKFKWTTAEMNNIPQIEVLKS